MDMSCATRSDILVVTFSGPFAEKDMDEIAARFREAVRGSGLMKVLVDARDLKGRPSIGYTYFHIQSLPVTGPAAKIAIVEVEENREQAGFYELAARNKGRYFQRVFFDLDEAMTWLNSQ
jgi:hypothetical protein